jgi:hypothetical protein
MQSDWWFTPEILSEGLTNLIVPADNLVNGSKEIKKASAITVYLHSIFVATSKDPSGKIKKRPGDANDLFIATTHKTGDTAKVQRIHYFKEKEPINRLYGNFFDSVIYSTVDFKNDVFLLNIQVYDIDSRDKYQEILSAVSENTNSIGVIFPALSPFTAMALPIAKGILNLVDTLDSHDKIIDDNLRLEIADPNIGTTILQTGNFIYFNKPQQEGLKFDSTKKVVDANGEPFTKCDYVVISIRNKEIPEINEWENNQKAAKLMSQLQGKGSGGKSSVEFVKGTLEGYNNFTKLQRMLELEKKQNPSPEEIALLAKLKQDKNLEPFLPQR